MYCRSRRGSYAKKLEDAYLNQLEISYYSVLYALEANTDFLTSLSERKSVFAKLT